MDKKNQSTLTKNEGNQWFSTWFNTPFYHILYHKRNHKEADSFISNLIGYLKPPTDSLVLDLACGTGRHAKTLNKCGLNVVGTDLSVNSIREAKKHENESLHFEVQDMRDVLRPLYFDYIFNLFTSFGYFDTLDDDEKVLKSCYQQLKPGGIVILDYFNIEKILPELPYKGIEIRKDIDFHIEKTYRDKRIMKTIEFESQGKPYHFEERVSAYNIDDFKLMFSQCGFAIKTIFGNYALENFTNNSERVIIIAEKS